MRLRLAILTVLVLVSVAGYAGLVYLRQFTFNEERALDKWSRMILNGNVDYILMKYGKEGYIKASSRNACSALYYRIGFKLKDYPFLSWKWRALKFPDLSSAKTEKERDDYAARVYVIFPFLNFSSSKFIEYIWAEDLPVGTILESPSGSNVKMIVARSGRPPVGQWVDERRNVHDDYVKAFGAKPKMNVGAIAIMCDADSAKTTAEALFDDIAIETEK